MGNEHNRWDAVKVVHHKHKEKWEEKNLINNDSCSRTIKSNFCTVNSDNISDDGQSE